MADHEGRAESGAETSVLRLGPENLRVPGTRRDPLLLTAAQRVAAPPALPPDAALRELVRDILREELQGPLGERITRNVRKLVLAEMRRAAALRDPD